jgi:ABC-type Na+ transport system ATPase subunit NatA
MTQNRPIALALRGVSKRFDRPAVDALDLTVHEGFSKGMGQKVALAGALVHDPKLIILDERQASTPALPGR